MKTILCNLLFAGVTLALQATSADAVAPQSITTNSRTAYSLPREHRDAGFTSLTSHAPDHATRHAGRAATYHTVTINVPRNEEEYQNQYDNQAVSVNGNADMEWGMPDEETGAIIFEVPAGKWDFVMVFQRMDVLEYVWLVKQDVEVNGDMTLSMDLAEAGNHIVFEAYTPDGKLPVSHWTDDNGNVRQEANVFDSRLSTGIEHRSGEGLGSYTLGFDIWLDEDGTRHDNALHGNVWVNDNTALTFTQWRYYTMREGNAICSMKADGCGTQTVTVTADRYIPFKSEFAPINNSFTGDDNFSVVTRTGICSLWDCGFGNSSGQSTFNGLNYDEDWDYTKYFVANTAGSDPASDGYVVMPLLSKKVCAVGSNSTGMIGNFGIDCPPALVTRDGATFIGNHTESHGYSYPGTFRDLDMAFKFPGRWPYFSNTDWGGYPNTFGDLKFGSTVPSTLFLRFGNQFSYYFIGQLGEKRTIDFINGSLDIKRNGETVADSYFKYVELMGNRAELAKAGPWDITIDNPNITVEGLPGRNYCEIHLAKTGSDNAPTVIQYAGRDAQGNIANCFDTPSDGRFSFCGGVVGYSNDPASPAIQGYLITEPAEVTVECAPYNSEAWEPLAVETVPEKFFMPGYGYYWESSLEAIDRMAPLGWFDVRITMTDPEGNSQMQVISPAFKIKELAGINNVSDGADEAIYADGDSIVAPDNAVVHNLAGMAVGRQGLSPGIYIVSTPLRAVKVTVR